MAENKRKTPSIRFKGFTDEWVECKLGDIVERSSAIGADDNLPRVEYEDIISGTGKLNKDIYAKESTKAGLRFHAGDVLYGKLRPYLKNWLLPSFSGLAVGDFWVLQSRNIDSRFLYSLIQSERFDKVANQSAGTKMPRADWSLVSKTEFAIPSNKQEQGQIGQFFLNLDNLIALQQSKCDSLMKLKKSLLQKMFPKDGSAFPEIRFEGFTDAWEERKLNEIVKSIDTGKSKFHSDSNNGEYAILGSTSIIGYDNCYDYDGEFILIARVGANAGSLYRYTGKAKISDNTVFIQAEKNIEFVYYVLTKFDIKQLSFGTGQPLIKASDLKNLDLKMPVQIAEQQKIGSFFANLDTLITLNKRKHEALMKLKKALLQKMFV